MDCALKASSRGSPYSLEVLVMHLVPAMRKEANRDGGGRGQREQSVQTNALMVPSTLFENLKTDLERA